MPRPRCAAPVSVQLMLAAGFDKEPPPGMLKPTPPAPGPRMDLEERYRLERPPGKKLDDAFYKNVAHAYHSAIAFGLNPRQAIIADTNVADATAAGWVLEARRRGHLPKTRPGKAKARPA